MEGCAGRPSSMDSEVDPKPQTSTPKTSKLQNLKPKPRIAHTKPQTPILKPRNPNPKPQAPNPETQNPKSKPPNP